MEQSQNERKEMSAGSGTPVNIEKEKKIEKTPATKDTGGKKPMNKFKAIGILVVIVIIWLLAVQFFAADRYEAVVNVIEGKNKVGINPLTERLDFGDLSRDNGAIRFVSLKNDGKRDKYIMIWKFGEISEIMKISRNNFTLNSEEEYRLEFNVYVPLSAETRVYEGKVWIFKFPKLF